MQVSKSFKFRVADYHMRDFHVSVSHAEIGLPEPSSVEEARQTYATLSMQVEALCLIEMVKCGLIHPDQIGEKLQPWLTKSNSTPMEPVSS